MTQNEDWSWVLWLALLGGGGYYLWDRYDIVDTEQVSLKEAADLIPEVERPLEPYEVTATPEGTSYSIDPQTVLGPRTERLAWFTVDHSNDKSVSHRTTRELVWTNCDTTATRTLESLQYDADGEIVNRWSAQAETKEVSHYPPGSIGYAQVKAMCTPAFDSMG